MGLISWFGGYRARSARAADTLLESGIAAFERGDLAAATRDFESALARRPGHGPSLNLLAVARLADGRLREAESLARDAVAAEPRKSLHWYNLGAVLAAHERPREAAEAFAGAVARDPANRNAWVNLARACSAIGDTAGALEAARALHALDPALAAHRAELGIALHRHAVQGASTTVPDEAIVLLESSASDAGLSPDLAADARKRLADALSRRHRHAEALAVIQAGGFAADDAEALVLHANCLNSLGRVIEAAPLYERVVELVPGHLAAVSSAVSAGEYDGRLDPPALVARRARLMRAFDGITAANAWRNPPDPARRLRIGYVSPDFRQHVAMSLFEGVLERHDRAGFEIFVYDATLARDARNAALRPLADHWRDIDAMPDEGVRDLMAADCIDILVDLAGHTTGNRLRLFAHKPAPVSATWLAYPGSTGLAAIDYLIGDPFNTPPGSDAWYTETVWRLPVTRFCYRPPDASPDPALPAAGARPTFGSFNNPSKLSDRTLALWAGVLDAVPGARLLLKYHGLEDAQTASRLFARMAATGIDTSRVELQGWSGYEETLADYRHVHVALDAWPFCGGLTSFDALWMGVPVVTLETPLLAGRQTLAMLRVMGHPELIAADDQSYVGIAAGLMGSPDRLADYRTALRTDMRDSALTDHAAFTRHLEDAFRAMWRHWCAGQASRSAVSPSP